jgi:hypothetical protein
VGRAARGGGLMGVVAAEPGVELGLGSIRGGRGGIEELWVYKGSGGEKTSSGR